MIAMIIDQQALVMGEQLRTCQTMQGERKADFPSAAASAGLLVLLLLFVFVLAPAPNGLAEPPTFRVMTYNIHHGEGADGKVDLARIAEVIRQQKAQIVALQEVDKGVERTQRRDFPAELAKLTGMTCVFSNNYHYQGGEYGNAVLTQFPIRQWTNTHLRMLRAGEQRGVLRLRLDVQGKDLLFMATHIDYRPDDAERVQNVAQFKEIVRIQEPVPIIFCGDFNDLPTSRTYRLMQETFRDVWTEVGQGSGLTITSTKPYRRIDYIWLSKETGPKPLKAWVPQTTASDHLPVVAEFEWP